VVELEDLLLRLPHALAVAALARQHLLALELVRLILLVAALRAAQPIRAHVHPEALGLVARGVALRAVGARVLAVERPAGELVIEGLLAALDRGPAHEIEAAVLVLLVADLALLALDQRRRVEALAGRDPRAQVLVIVTAEALVVRQIARAVDVAVVALVLRVERGVARRERARRGREEVIG
jgi:hypothetical protein